MSLRGDIALATRLQQIAAKLDIDFEEAFARHLGDAPAHELVRAMRGVRRLAERHRHGVARGRLGVPAP